MVIYLFSILVVEDDTNTRRLMSVVLKANGYFPYLAADGEEALDVLAKQHIDLMVIDILMPTMDGYELTNQLREAAIHYRF
jgi:two-component system, OmpR family, response regulator